MIRRCEWCGNDPLYIAYHDKEWGVPEYDDRKLFEMLILEGAQAGLNWLTILKKRDNYRRAFHRFDPNRVAGYNAKDIDRLLHDPGIVRNRLKIEAAITNARGYLQILKEHTSFSDYLWAFVDHTPIINNRATHADIPAQTAVSEVMSRDLKKRGFSFVGPTICYAFMQAVGMVNDHLVDCFRHAELK
jgi:DNA-3-methyladenine glycosylase I